MSSGKHLPDSSQLQRFKDLAKQLDTDEDEARFEDQVRRIAKTPPPKKDEGDAE